MAKHDLAAGSQKPTHHRAGRLKRGGIFGQQGSRHTGRAVFDQRFDQPLRIDGVEQRPRQIGEQKAELAIGMAGQIDGDNAAVAEQLGAAGRITARLDLPLRRQSVEARLEVRRKQLLENAVAQMLPRSSRRA